MSIVSAPADVASVLVDPIAALIKNPFSTSVPNNGERGKDFPGGFVVTEYSHGQPVPATIIKLVGNMMPMQPFPWGGEQRLNKEYYPGNPEAAVQVLGPKEGPLVIKGRFKDKRYRDNSYFGVSYMMANAFDLMRKRGNLVKFGMDGQGGKWWRWGFIEKVDFKMNRLSWVDYEIEFFVISDLQPKNNYFAAPEKQAPDSVNQNLINQAAAFQANYSAVPSSVPQSIAGLLNNLIGDVAKNINLVTNFVSTILSTGQDIANSANRAVGLIKNVRSQISSFNRQFDSIAHTFATFSSDATSAAQQTIAAFKSIHYMQETMGGASFLSSYLAQMQAQFEALAKQVPKARYKVQAGDTLQNISVKFYQIPDHWTDIYDHNHLQSATLVAGTVLEIPNL